MSPQPSILLSETDPELRRRFAELITRCGYNQLRVTESLPGVHLLPGSGPLLLLCSCKIFIDHPEELYNAKNGNARLRIIALCETDHSFPLHELSSSLADSFLLKSGGLEEFRFAIISTEKGVRYFSPQIATRLASVLARLKANGEPVSHTKLNNREQEILRLVVEGYTNQQIAKKIFASKRTIESYRMRLIDKTGSKNTASLIRFAVENGIVN